MNRSSPFCQRVNEAFSKGMLLDFDISELQCPMEVVLIYTLSRKDTSHPKRQSDRPLSQSTLST
jgi:hypothetical protein